MFSVASYIPTTLIIWCLSMVNSLCCCDDLLGFDLFQSKLQEKDNEGSSFFLDWRCDSRNVRDSDSARSTVQIGRGRGVLDLIYRKIKRSIHNSHEKGGPWNTCYKVARIMVYIYPRDLSNEPMYAPGTLRYGAWCLQRILKKTRILTTLGMI